MYSFVYKKNIQLPKLSWLADINKQTKNIEVYCGSKVECFSNFFVAGAWDGEFVKAEFDTCDAFYGTGGKIKEKSLIFSTPSHSLERLLFYEIDNNIYISNSLSFIMSFTNLELDRGEDQYESYFCSVLDGINKYKKSIPMNNCKHIHQVIVSNIVISESGNLSIERRPKMNSFTSFDDYNTRIVKSCILVNKNANSIKRNNSKFGLVTTISSGYDSACCCAIAKQIGCNCAVSLSGGAYDKDDGTPIAKKLGYDYIIRRNKDLYKKNKYNIDAEYVSSGEIGTMMQFSVFEDVFSDNIVFFGARGSYWEKELDMTEDFEMDNYYYYETDISWTENALKNGYICIPLPAYGASVCNSIKDVTNSKDMNYWTLGTKYDKPIPRRIVETSGVLRKEFGQVKYGGGFYLGYDTTHSLKFKLSEEGYKNLLTFKKGFHYKKPLKHFKNGCKFYKCLFPTYLMRLCSKFGINLKVKQRTPRIANPFVPSILFFWSIDEMKSRYIKALNLK